MNITIQKKEGHSIHKDMIGLFFEDINYAADGGLYAEMLENRSFEFYKTGGDVGSYYTEFDGGYGWNGYPQTGEVSLKVVMGSPLCTENPHYMRVTAATGNVGLSNKAYDGIFLKKGMDYKVTFFARCVSFEGSFTALVEKDGQVYAQGTVSAGEGKDETYNYLKKYELTITANEDVDGAVFALLLSDAGVVELDFVSMFPADAVAGVFRKDLFDLLKGLHPGFLRFPGGCIIEGNTMENRYRYKDSLTQPWKRKNNWNRWAVHGNSAEVQEGPYAHYNQTLGLGFYEYFLLCELIGAKPLPVLNVGLACQYQSTELVPIDSPEFWEYVQDAIDLIEFANGSVDTKWGAVRASLGHPEPFNLTMMGIGNEQWQTDKVDFFERYVIFEREIHAVNPEIKLIGSAGPDITSEKYENAWAFHREHEDDPGFAYALDEHYYVKPQWLFEHVDFYDNYSRKLKVFAGEYAAHPLHGMNMPEANTLEGALAEAAFLTGIERNSDVVILASYAPLFARMGYSQWSPDMIWFDAKTACGSPSYYVQKLYGENIGDVTLLTEGAEKEAAKEGIYYSLSYLKEEDRVILKVVNRNDKSVKVQLDMDAVWAEKESYTAEIMCHEDLHAYNRVEDPEKVKPYQACGSVKEGLELPAYSFAVVRI